MEFKPEYIENLSKIVSDNNLSEISLKEDGREITIKKDNVEKIEVKSETTNEQKEVIENRKSIISPMVGTFYMAPSPDSDPFVEIGTEVKEGDVICILEAMKLMNEIKSEINGKVVQICVKNGEPVEYGQVLMYLE